LRFAASLTWEETARVTMETLERVVREAATG
jgi:hypothetical protein